jgi:hypothetical protein
MLDPQFAAQERVAGAVAGLGNVLSDAAVKMQQASDYRHLANLDNQMEQAWGSYNDALNENSDEGKWVDSWKKTLAETVKQVTPKNADPSLKQRFELRAKEFEATTTVAMGHRAQRSGVVKARAAGIARDEQLWHEGDEVNALENIKAMKSLGLLHEDEAQRMAERGKTKMARQQAFAAINANPVDAHEKLSEKTDSGRWRNWPALDEDDRTTLITRARWETTARQTAAYSDLIDGLNSGDVKTPEQLQQLVDSKLITPRQMKSYVTAYRKGQVNVDPIEVGQLLSDITNYDPKSDPDMTKRAALLGRIATGG